MHPLTMRGTKRSLGAFVAPLWAVLWPSLADAQAVNSDASERNNRRLLRLQSRDRATPPPKAALLQREESEPVLKEADLKVGVAYRYGDESWTLRAPFVVTATLSGCDDCGVYLQSDYTRRRSVDQDPVYGARSVTRGAGFADVELHHFNNLVTNGSAWSSEVDYGLIVPTHGSIGSPGYAASASIDRTYKAKEFSITAGVQETVQFYSSTNDSGAATSRHAHDLFVEGTYALPHELSAKMNFGRTLQRGTKSVNNALLALSVPLMSRGLAMVSVKQGLTRGSGGTGLRFDISIPVSD